jgi:hypothetical protein
MRRFGALREHGRVIGVEKHFVNEVTETARSTSWAVAVGSPLDGPHSGLKTRVSLRSTRAA